MENCLQTLAENCPQTLAENCPQTLAEDCPQTLMEDCLLTLEPLETNHKMIVTLIFSPVDEIGIVQEGNNLLHFSIGAGQIEM